MGRSFEIQGTPQEEPEKPAYDGGVPANAGISSVIPEAHAALPSESDWGWTFEHAVMTRGQRVTLAITAPAGWSISGAPEIYLDGQRQHIPFGGTHEASKKLAFILDSYSPGSKHHCEASARATKGEDSIERSWSEEWLDV